jgi:hypothetical protein
MDSMKELQLWVRIASPELLQRRMSEGAPYQGPWCPDWNHQLFKESRGTIPWRLGRRGATDPRPAIISLSLSIYIYSYMGEPEGGTYTFTQWCQDTRTCSQIDRICTDFFKISVTFYDQVSGMGYNLYVCVCVCHGAPWVITHRFLETLLKLDSGHSICLEAHQCIGIGIVFGNAVAFDWTVEHVKN